MEDKKRELKPYNAVIQVCPICHKVDVYKDDGHYCNAEDQARRDSDLNEDYKL